MTKKVTIEELGIDLKRRIDEVKEQEAQIEKKLLALADREQRVKYREEKATEREFRIFRRKLDG